MRFSNIILISYRHLDLLYPIGKLFVKKEKNNVDPDLAFQYDVTWVKQGFTLGSDLPLSPKIYYANFSNCFKFLLDFIGPDWLEFIPNSDPPKSIDPLVKSLFLKQDAYQCSGVYGNILLGNRIVKHEPLKLTKQSAKEIYQSVDGLDRNPEKLTKDAFFYLLKYASCIRGQHPKFSVYFDNTQELYVFRPYRHSRINVNLWRFIINLLAKEAGLKVVSAYYQYNAYIEQRFDFIENNYKTVLSARTLSTKESQKISWLDVADIINIYGARPKENLVHLFRRCVFDCLVLNEHDTVENIWFYRTPRGWELAPLFSPLPKIMTDGLRTMAMPILSGNKSASLSLILKSSPYFGLSQTEAKNIILETQKVTSQWREYAKKYGVSSSEIELLAPTFEF